MLRILYHSKDTSLAHLVLTPRGKAVFLLVVDGYSIEEIGKKLGITNSGVRRHKENMLSANNCSSMHELIGKYYMQGQLEHHKDISASEHE